ncbi:MAG: hypothetical protein RTU63_07365 [Candidatus Thorarchaeota archaeon]
MIKATKPAAAPAPAPTPAAPAPVAPTPAAPAPTISPDEHKAVKPSEVSKDRVRVAGASRGKSELDKAREAFAKAETVGIDEADGSGVIETRMLRASEVKELLEGPSVMATADAPPPTMMEGSEPLPPEAAAMMTPSMPTSSQIEQSILGAKSAYVESEPEPTAAAVPPDPLVSAPIPEEFTSSKYEGAVESPPGTDEPTTGFTSHAPPAAAAPAPAAAPVTDTTYEDDIDLVIACPDCGKTINVDMFEYPREVYGAMGAARLKQARFFVVQGKGNDALRIIRMAHALYAKAGDDKGLAEVKKIIETLAKKP